ncbi:MAG: CHAT domain-containing protein [bacterium]|nr:CHAT domain-containing protein [bacterium]
MTAPDLRILVYRKERDEGLSLSFQLEARDPELKLHFAAFEPMPLRRLTEELIRDLFDGIAKLSLLGDADELRRQLDAKGSRLTKDLLPRELLAELWRVRDRVETVEVLSAEGFVPWELLKLLEPVGRHQFRDGPFFGEIFALARWIPDLPQRLHLPLRRLAVIASHDPVLPATAEEIAFLESLAGQERRVDFLRSQRTELLEAMAAGRHDGWHFTGHAVDRPGDPESSGLPLEDYTELTPEDLHGVAGELGRSGPLVFLNGCHTGRTGPTPSGWSGWSRRLLEAGAGAFLGASWATSDEPAAHFARTFYRFFTGGLPIAEAVRRARIEIRERFPADPTWLAYTVYAHPLARCRTAPAVAGASSPLARPIESRKDLDRLPVFTGPRLLGRSEELSRLREAFEQQGVSIVSLVGFGGVGKSALSAEFVERLAPDYAGAEAVFAWSFYSQGSHSTATSSAEFFDAALRFFCPSEDMPTDDGERVQMLSRALRSQRALLILDGVEPLQNPAHVDGGRFRDKALRHLFLGRHRP